MKLCAFIMVAMLFCGCTAEELYPLSEENIKNTTNYLCNDIGIRVSGSEEEQSTATMLKEQISEYGYSEAEGTLYAENFVVEGKDSANIIAVYNKNPDLPLITIVTHYDSVPTSVGAGDNAVANGILLEISRYLQSEEADFDAEIRMVFLGSEENGYHGSKYYVENLSEYDYLRHIAGYNMDISAAQSDDTAYLVCNTLGGNSEGGYVAGDYFSPMENAVSMSVSAAYSELYGEGYGGTHNLGESDHVSFHERELDSANVCWRQLEGGFPILPSEYHKESDTPDKLNYSTAVITGRTVLGAIDILLSQ